MGPYTLTWDTLIFEIRYATGHLYFDRCGQTLLDIEGECEGWLAGPVDPQTGTLERPDKWYRVNFNNSKFDFTADKAHKNKIEDIANECSKIWRIIQANFGLEEFIRIGCRINYILPTGSIEESEKLLKKATLNVNYPERLNNPEFTIKTRQIITMVSKNKLEYRLQLAGVTRTEGVRPSDIVRKDPKTLSKNQKKFRLARLQQLREYSANPMYGVYLDVDCAQYAPPKIEVDAFINGQFKTVKEDFLPILEEL
jgi:hypothetical protein